MAFKEPVEKDYRDYPVGWKKLDKIQWGWMVIYNFKITGDVNIYCYLMGNLVGMENVLSFEIFSTKDKPSGMEVQPGL